MLDALIGSRRHEGPKSLPDPQSRVKNVQFVPKAEQASKRPTPAELPDGTL